jgi:hypothetical protein
MRWYARQAQFHVAPEIQDDGAQGADMHRDVDHLPLILQSRQIRQENQMPEDEIGRNSVIPWISATRRR